MVSKYDVFYAIALKGEIDVVDIVEALNKSKKEYQNIFNNVLKLEKQRYIQRGDKVKVIHSEKSKKLFRLISFCARNSINYNLMFKKTMLEFIHKAAKKEFFTINDVKIHPQTFNFYVSALAKYGFMLIASRKPLKCKLLRHHFLIDLTNFFDMSEIIPQDEIRGLKTPSIKRRGMISEHVKNRLTKEGTNKYMPPSKRAVFNEKLIFYTPKQHSLINEIKKELKKYKRNLKIHYTVIDDLESKEEVNFIYSSLNLEGNPLTLPETQKLVLENVVPEKHKLIHIQEVTNYKKAVDFMVANAKKNVRLDLQLILRYHKIAMSHIHGAGVIRKQNVRIKFNLGFKTSDWHLIPLKLNELMRRYDEFEGMKKDVEKTIQFASFFHNEFQRIHPFIDGNSRISRLLMIHILRSNGIPMLDLPLGYFDLYMDLTKRSTKRDDKSFRYLIEEIIFMNLRELNV